jgi:hypothetical protein
MTGRPRSSKPSVGVRELKTHAARIVREGREARASYVLTHLPQVTLVTLAAEMARQALKSHPFAGANA